MSVDIPVFFWGGSLMEDVHVEYPERNGRILFGMIGC
jgi:hypothetical protein